MSSLTRLARLAWPHRNPVARTVDRVESVSLVVVVLVALVLLPVLLVVGSIVHADLVDQGERQAASAHAVDAVLTADAPRTTFDGHGVVLARTSGVPAMWTAPDGTVHTGRVQATKGRAAGATVRTWVDWHGDLVAAPVSAADAAAGGFFIAFGGWAGAVALLAAVQACVHLGLNRRRYRRWDQQWARV
jgi:hypothetical protein